MRITFKDVNYTYNKKTPFEKKVLKNINLNIEENSYTVIIGKTGSGKSTLIEHINGLLISDSGQVKVGDSIIKYPKNRKERKNLSHELTELRKDVAVLFQFSEQQLFETTVLKDIMFAPLNYGVSIEEAEKRARELAKLVGLNEEHLEKSPFELSGGEMRKVALCGVLSLNPKVLILDEPTIALDYRSKKELMELIKELKEQFSMTIVLVTHNMDYVLHYADKVIVIDKGEIKVISDVKTLFSNKTLLEETSLTQPDTISIYEKLIEKGIEFKRFPRTYDDLVSQLVDKIKENDNE